MNTGRQPIHAVPDYKATLAEVAEALGVTTERVRQIEANALHKVRRALEARGFDAREWADHLHSLRERDGWPF